MPEKMILWLERRLPASYRPFIGPKAASLCTLRGLGVKVPPGFCVTTSAFRKHLDANGLRPQIAARLDRTPPAIEEIRQLMTGAPLMDLLHEQIAASYAQLGAGTVAVRSSATAEDLPGHSFAGQYETVLSITSLEDCLEAVKRCWA